MSGPRGAAGRLRQWVSRHRVLTAAAGAGLAAITALSVTLALTSGGAPAPARSVAAATVAPRPSPTPHPTPHGAAARPVHRGAGQVARAGARGEDRQHRVRPAADRAAVRRPRVRDPGRGRAHPVHGRLLLARPAGRRAGAQRQAERPGPAAPVRAARVRLVRRDAAPGAVHRAGAGRRPVRAPGRRLLPQPEPGRAVQPVREHEAAARRGARREQGQGHRVPVRPGAGQRSARGPRAPRRTR